MKSKLFALICTLLLLFTGCAYDEPIDFYFTRSKLKYESVENVIIETEFPEYPTHATEIALNITNNGDEDFRYEFVFRLQKEENGEWRDLMNSGTYAQQIMTVPPNSTSRYIAFLKGHFPLMLPEGKYRIGIGTAEPSKYAWGEFTLKTKIELAENVIIESKFPEYPPDTERILVKITNNNDDEFIHETVYRLQKEENGEWRSVRNENGINDLLLCAVPANSTIEETYISLYGYPNPLPEGKYRIGVGTSNPPRYAWCEFTIK